MKFKDSTGFEWQPQFNVTIARDIRTACEIDLLTLAGSGKAFERMETDRELLARTLFLACAGQSMSEGIDEAEFGRRLAGEVFNEAQKALRGSVIEFLSPPKYHLSNPNLKRPTGAIEPGGMSEFSTMKGESSGRLSG